MKLRYKEVSVSVGNGSFETTLSVVLSKLGIKEPKS